MFSYRNQRMVLAAFIPFYVTAMWYLTSDLVSMELLAMLQTAVIPLMILSRVS